MTEARENCGRICSTKRVKKVGPRLPELAPAARGSQKVGSGNLGHTFLPAQYVSRALGCLQSLAEFTQLRAHLVVHLHEISRLTCPRRND